MEGGGETMVMVTTTASHKAASAKTVTMSSHECTPHEIVPPSRFCVTACTAGSMPVSAFAPCSGLVMAMVMMMMMAVVFESAPVTLGIVLLILLGLLALVLFDFLVAGHRRRRRVRGDRVRALAARLVDFFLAAIEIGGFIVVKVAVIV